MEKYFAKDKKDLEDKLFLILEEKEKSKIFTMRILEETKEGFEVLVVFENKNILTGFVNVEKFGDEIGVRIRANYI